MHVQYTITHHDMRAGTTKELRLNGTITLAVGQELTLDTLTQELKNMVGPANAAIEVECKNTPAPDNHPNDTNGH